MNNEPALARDRGTYIICTQLYYYSMHTYLTELVTFKHL